MSCLQVALPSAVTKLRLARANVKPCDAIQGSKLCVRGSWPGVLPREGSWSFLWHRGEVSQADVPFSTVFKSNSKQSLRRAGSRRRSCAGVLSPSVVFVRLSAATSPAPPCSASVRAPGWEGGTSLGSLRFAPVRSGSLAVLLRFAPVRSGVGSTSGSDRHGAVAEHI